jgi:hypothetical protein
MLGKRCRLYPARAAPRPGQACAGRFPRADATGTGRCLAPEGGPAAEAESFPPRFPPTTGRSAVASGLPRAGDEPVPGTGVAPPRAPRLPRRPRKKTRSGVLITGPPSLGGGCADFPPLAEPRPSRPLRGAAHFAVIDHPAHRPARKAAGRRIPRSDLSFRRRHPLSGSAPRGARPGPRAVPSARPSASLPGRRAGISRGPLARGSRTKPDELTQRFGRAAYTGGGRLCPEQNA